MNVDQIVLFRILRELAGYIQAGDSQTVSFGQDDATMEWWLKAGNKTYSGGHSLENIICVAGKDLGILR